MILPDVRGLYRFYEELALRLGEQGSRAVAIDYFGRTAGVGKRDDDFQYRPHVPQTTPRVSRPTWPRVACLREPGRGRLHGRVLLRRPPLMAVGRGGHGLAGAIGFYGRPVRERTAHPARPSGPGSSAPPILGADGRRRPGIPVEDVRAFESALAAAGVEHEIVIYDGAPHSFFDRKQEEFADASADAWSRVLGFIERHSG